MPETDFRSVVVVPTLNEADTIRLLLDRVSVIVPNVDVLVVDDQSPDGTADVVTAFAEKHPRVHLLSRAPRGGFAGAYKAGFAWALQRDYDFIVQMDADGSHQPEHLPEMFERAYAGAGLVIGSRWTSGGRVVDWPLQRLILSRGGNVYIRVMLGTRVRDATGGFRIWSREALTSVQPYSLLSEGYSFQIEMLRRAERQHVTIAEVPIVFPERVLGESKMSRHIIMEALQKVTRWGFEDRVARLTKNRRPASSPA